MGRTHAWERHGRAVMIRDAYPSEELRVSLGWWNDFLSLGWFLLLLALVLAYGTKYVAVATVQILRSLADFGLVGMHAATVLLGIFFLAAGLAILGLALRGCFNLIRRS